MPLNQLECKKTADSSTEQLSCLENSSLIDFRDHSDQLITLHDGLIDTYHLNCSFARYMITFPAHTTQINVSLCTHNASNAIVETVRCSPNKAMDHPRLIS